MRVGGGTHAIGVAIFAAIACATAHAAHGAPRPRPQPTTIRVPGAGRVRSSAEAAPSSRIIYLNRCGAGGCPVHQGSDDSRTQTSSIAGGAVSIGQFTQTDDIWTQLVTCVTQTYAPFDVTITDVDPGDVPHFEVIVGGVPTDLGADLPADVGGVSPFDCAEIPNSISYVFDVYGPDPLSLCWTASQESAHGFGLDHELLQADPMTYIEGNLPKRFQPIDASCGEDVARACRCPETTQNSFRLIEAMFGDGVPTPPTIAIEAPTDGAIVQPTFALRLTATDDVAVDHLELWIDGVQVAMSPTSPWVLNAPDVALGPHTVELRAYDIQQTLAKTSVSVTVVAPCGPAAPCTGDDVCVNGACVDGPDVSGGVGAQCTSNGQCLLGLCASNGSDVTEQCTAACDPSTAASCPSGFDCLSATGGSVCWLSSGGGCCDAGGAPGGSVLLALVVLGAWRRRAVT